MYLTTHVKRSLQVDILKYGFFLNEKKYFLLSSYKYIVLKLEI